LGRSLPTDEELAASLETLEFDRTLAFFDGPEMVATAGIFSYDMTVPGGSLPCGGVTRVSVRSTHRRRGLLTAMMRRQLDEMHERGEPLAALYASEAPIYGRFGYGLATYQAEIEIDRARAVFARPTAGRGRIVMVDAESAIPAFTRVWDQVRRDQPGMLALDERWLRYELVDLEINRQGASPHYRVLFQDEDNTPAGFAVYRIKMAWDPSGPSGTLRLESLIADTADAYAALWRHLLDIDLMVRISAEMRPPDEPLRFLLARLAPAKNANRRRHLAAAGRRRRRVGGPPVCHRWPPRHSRARRLLPMERSTARAAWWAGRRGMPTV